MKAPPLPELKGLAADLQRFADMEGGRPTIYRVSGFNLDADEPGLYVSSCIVVRYEPRKGFKVVHRDAKSSFAVRFTVSHFGHIILFDNTLNFGKNPDGSLREVLIEGLSGIKLREPEPDPEAFVKAHVQEVVFRLVKCASDPIRIRYDEPGGGPGRG